MDKPKGEQPANLVHEPGKPRGKKKLATVTKRQEEQFAKADASEEMNAILQAEGPAALRRLLILTKNPKTPVVYRIQIDTWFAEQILRPGDSPGKGSASAQQVLSGTFGKIEIKDPNGGRDVTVSFGHGERPNAEEGGS